MEQNPNNLSFTKPLLYLGVLILILAGLLALFVSINKQRAVKIYQTYAGETQEYIKQNKPQLLTLFNDIFPKKECLKETALPQPCSHPAQDTISNLLPPTLKDWSSTAFLKKDQGEILLMRLSGNTFLPYMYPPQKTLALNRLLDGEVEQIPWDDYLNDLPSKEVVIAVKDNSGKVVGAIIRSVIEEKGL